MTEAAPGRWSGLVSRTFGDPSVLACSTAHCWPFRTKPSRRRPLRPATWSPRRTPGGGPTPAAGLTPLLIAGDTATVRDLNQRARADLIAAGLVDPDGVTLHDGLIAGPGDRIVTREINRYLEDGTGYEPVAVPGSDPISSQRGEDTRSSPTQQGYA